VVQTVMFEWSEDYSMKIPSIDAQHKKLVAMLNDLYAGMMTNASREAASATLAGLTEYTLTHFAYEEKLFREYGFPHTEAHEKEHQALVQAVVEFKARFDAGEASINMELMNFLKDWLIKHILGSDKRYSKFLRERGVK